jgi:hypothetical protein
MRPKLADVTICAADCVSPGLALRAIQKSMDLCDFGDAILFCDTPVTTCEGVRYQKIDRLASRNDYSRFILKDLANQIKTPFALIVQWDGYVLDPVAWRAEFTQYDLIGARWPWHKEGNAVGNGGFTLRSLKLLKAIAHSSYPFLKDIPEDEQICRVYRDRLISEHGIRFAPVILADSFSYERALPDAPTFGFHGVFNMWRYLDDDEMVALSLELGSHVLNSAEFCEVVVQYFLMRKFDPFKQMYVQMRRHCSKNEFVSHAEKFTNNVKFADYLGSLGESLVRRMQFAQPSH